MNKRQAKKKEANYYELPYRERKEINRRAHELSINLARKENRNYWEGWDRGYPNRFRIKNFFRVLR